MGNTSRNSAALHQLVGAIEEAVNAIFMLAIIAETLEDNPRSCPACVRLRILPALEAWLASTRDDYPTMDAGRILDGNHPKVYIAPCAYCLEMKGGST